MAPILVKESWRGVAGSERPYFTGLSAVAFDNGAGSLSAGPSSSLASIFYSEFMAGGRRDFSVTRNNGLITTGPPQWDERSRQRGESGGGRVPSEAELSPVSFRAMLLFQRPTFFAVGRAVNALTSRSRDQRIGKVSFGAYVLMCVTLISL